MVFLTLQSKIHLLELLMPRSKQFPVISRGQTIGSDQQLVKITYITLRQTVKKATL